MPRMAYCTIDDLEAWIGEATLARLTTESQETEPTSYNEPLVSDAIDQASSLMDTYLAAQFTTPVNVDDLSADLYHPELAGVLKMHCIAVLHWRLHTQLKGEDVPERIQKAYDESMAWLRDVAAGTITLAGGDADHGSVGSAELFRGDEHWREEQEEE